MSLARQQFRVLYRDFLTRIIDLEIVSTQGDPGNLLGRIMAILAALGITFYALGAVKYINGYEFAVSATIAACGLFAVFAWNAVFPDKRDCLILGPLPVPRHIMALARLAAIATALLSVIASLNAFTGLAFGFTTDDSLAGVARAFLAWSLAMLAAGGFVFSFVLSMQGLASQVLSWRLFLRVSGALQLLALFVVLALFFLTPPFLLTLQHPTFIVQFLPSYWFTGLLLVLNGNHDPRFATLAGIALRNLALSLGAAGCLYSASWIRNIRRIAEAPDIAPAIRSRVALARFLPGTPLDKAILLFTWRTIARSRQHRLLLAAYGGMGFAVTLAFSGSFLMGVSKARWDRPNVPMMVAGLLLLTVALAGMRSLFVLPQTLQANWIFRLTMVHDPASYSRATFKTLLTLTAFPLWIAAAVGYFSAWPLSAAAQHMAVLVLAGWLFAERSLYGFRKIPFTCSWLPEGHQMRLKTGIWMIVFVIFAGLMTSLELWAMGAARRYVVLLASLAAATLWAARRNAEFTASPANRLLFDELPPVDIFAIDLRNNEEE